MRNLRVCIRKAESAGCKLFKAAGMGNMKTMLITHVVV